MLWLGHNSGVLCSCVADYTNNVQYESQLTESSCRSSLHMITKLLDFLQPYILWGGGLRWRPEVARVLWAYWERSTTFQGVLIRSLLVQKGWNMTAEHLKGFSSLVCTYLAMWYPYASELSFLTLFKACGRTALPLESPEVPRRGSTPHWASLIPGLYSPAWAELCPLCKPAWWNAGLTHLHCCW